jgi:hypothetical protein
MNPTKAMELIESSFLNFEDKKKLRGLLDIQGADEIFFDRFDIFLVEEIKRRTERYKNTIHGVDETTKRLTGQIVKDRLDILRESEERLLVLDIADFREREKVWEEYDRKIAEVETRFNTEFRSESANLLLKSSEKS